MPTRGALQRRASRAVMSSLPNTTRTVAAKKMLRSVALSPMSAISIAGAAPKKL